MSDIQRYEPWPQEWPQEDLNGSLVTYEDHKKIVEELLQENENLRLLIDELTKTCETLVNERERLHKAVLKAKGLDESLQTL